MDIEEIWNRWEDVHAFSGVFSVKNKEGVVFEKNCGFRNKSEQLPNQPDTSFGIASGTKSFTALAVCRLLEAEKLHLEDTIGDILPYDLGNIRRDISVYNLLTHTSGVGDYIDEEAPDSYETEQKLCNTYPVYLWEELQYYLKMITPLPAKFEPGARYSYSNAGFVLLGLVVEAIGKKPYQQFVQEEIIQPLQLRHTGFYRTDALPANTAHGYIKDSAGGWRSNIFSLPVVGGADGGLYTCAGDMDVLWRSLFSGKLLSEAMLQNFLRAHIVREKGKNYGLGVYSAVEGEKAAYFVVGGDFGVDFFSAYFPAKGITATALGNTETDTFPLLDEMLKKYSINPV